MFSSDIGRRLRSVIALRGYTQAIAAQKIGISPATFSAKLSGRTRFYADELCNLANWLNTSVDYLLGRDTAQGGA